MPGHLFKPGQRHRIPKCHLVRIKDPPIAYCHCMVDLIIRKTQSVFWINPWCKLLLLVREMREGRTSDITHPILSTYKERSNIFNDFFFRLLENELSWGRRRVKWKLRGWDSCGASAWPPASLETGAPPFLQWPPSLPGPSGETWLSTEESLLLIVLLIEHRNYFYRISDLCHFQS